MLLEQVQGHRLQRALVRRREHHRRRLACVCSLLPPAHMQRALLNKHSSATPQMQFTTVHAVAGYCATPAQTCWQSKVPEVKACHVQAVAGFGIAQEEKSGAQPTLRSGWPKHQAFLPSNALDTRTCKHGQTPAAPLPSQAAHLDTQRHQRSPGFRPGKLGGRGVLRSLPRGLSVL